MEQYLYEVGGAVLFIGALSVIVHFIRKMIKNRDHYGAEKRHNIERLLKIRAYTERAAWDIKWPQASDVYLVICSLPKRIRRSNSAVHRIIARHFKMEHVEVIRMMRVYRKDILQKLLEDSRLI